MEEGTLHAWLGVWRSRVPCHIWRYHLVCMWNVVPEVFWILCGAAHETFPGQRRSRFARSPRVMFFVEVVRPPALGDDMLRATGLIFNDDFDEFSLLLTLLFLYEVCVSIFNLGRSIWTGHQTIFRIRSQNAGVTSLSICFLWCLVILIVRCQRSSCLTLDRARLVLV